MRKILTHGASKDLVWAVANSRHGYFKKIYFPCNISKKNIHLLSETSLLPFGG